MNTYLHLFNRVQRRLLVCLVTLSVLGLAVIFGSISRAQQTGWQVEVAEGQKTSATLGITNRCLEPHFFRVREDINYLTFQEPTDSILIAPGARKPLAALFDASGLKSQVYKDEVIVECLDCKKEKASRCTQDRDKVPVLLTVTKSGPAPMPAAMAVSTPIISTPTFPTPYPRSSPFAGAMEKTDSTTVEIEFKFKFKRIKKTSSMIANIEPANGNGNGTIRIDGNRLRLTFTSQVAVPDNTIHIDRNYDLVPELASALGYKNVLLKAGTCYRPLLNEHRRLQ